MMKYSRQREAIKEYLMGRTDHPTAEMVYLSVRETNPKISLGTVYRNLSLLVSLGEIQKICCGDGVERYDANLKPHYHYHCTACGCVMDVPLAQVPSSQILLGDTFPEQVDGYTVLFHGTCRSCREKVKKTVDKPEKVC